jgi:hypothetical protein
VLGIILMNLSQGTSDLSLFYLVLG